MNTPVLFLLGAVALSALGGIVVWIASRPRPEKFGSSIETFNRDLNALAPAGQKRRSRRPARSPQQTHQAGGASTNGGRPGPRTPTPQPAAATARPKPGPRPDSRS